MVVSALDAENLTGAAVVILAGSRGIQPHGFRAAEELFAAAGGDRPDRRARGSAGGAIARAHGRAGRLRRGPRCRADALRIRRPSPSRLLLRRIAARRAVIHVLAPASEQGHRGVDELQQQVINLFASSRCRKRFSTSRSASTCWRATATRRPNRWSAPRRGSNATWRRCWPWARPSRCRRCAWCRRRCSTATASRFGWSWKADRGARDRRGAGGAQIDVRTDGQEAAHQCRRGGAERHRGGRDRERPQSSQARVVLDGGGQPAPDGGERAWRWPPSCSGRARDDAAAPGGWPPRSGGGSRLRVSRFRPRRPAAEEHQDHRRPGLRQRHHPVQTGGPAVERGGARVHLPHALPGGGRPQPGRRRAAAARWSTTRPTRRCSIRPPGAPAAC